MRRKKRGPWGGPFSSASLLALALLIPCAVPRPVSLVHQEAEQPATPLRNKGPSAAAAASRKKPPRPTKSFPSPAAVPGEHGDDDALLSSEVDATLFGGGGAAAAGAAALLVREESSRVEDNNNALAVVGEQRQPQPQEDQSTLVVAGTVDGQVHALDPATGDLRWSFDTGEPLVKSFQQLPGALDEKKWLIPALDGSVLVHTAQGLRRPGLKARHLVEQAPFLDSGGIFYTGSKVSRIYGVDARTGEVRQVLSGDTADSLESNRRLLARSGSDENVIWVGRNDHTIHSFYVPTGQEEWNLTIGEFVSLDGLYLAASSATVSGTTPSAAAGSALADPFPALTATPEGGLRSSAAAAAGKGGSRGRGSSDPDWSVPLPSHVSSVFRVALEEGSVHTYLPMQEMPLSQSSGARAAAAAGSGGASAVGILENGQVFAVALGEHGLGEGEDGGGTSSGGPGGHGSRGKKGRAGEGKVTHGGRTTATQPLLPHGGDWQQHRDGGDSSELDGGGGGHSMSGSLVQSWLSKGSPQSAAATAFSSPPKWCQPGHSAFPSCLVGVHTVQNIGAEELGRLSLGMGLHLGGGNARGGGGGPGTGARDLGVRTRPGDIGRLPPLPSDTRGSDDSNGGLLSIVINGLGMSGVGGGGGGGGGGGRDAMLHREEGAIGNYLAPAAPPPQGPLEALLGWLHRGWNIVSLGLLAVLVMVVVDSRRAARLFKQVGLGGYPLYRAGDVGDGRISGEYDPTADSGFSGASDGSASGAAAGGRGAGGGAIVVPGGVRGEVRVGCLTVSDTVLGYGSHGTVVYRGLLEGRPVAVKRMLTDFHARADREISLLIESDGHPNVVRYFVREEAGEFVYLALQLCHLSLHNAMAQIHSAMAQSRRKAEHEEGRSGGPRVGLGRALTADDVSAPLELRAALLQVSQGVEHLHGLRIVHRDLKPHNILLAAKDRKGPGLGRRVGGTQQAEGGGGEGKEDGEGALVAPRKLSNMRDLAKFVLKISDMGLGKQLLNGQSSFGMSSYGRAPGVRDQGQGGDALARARASNAQASSSAGGHVGSIGWQAPEVIADRVSLEGGQDPSAGTAAGGGPESSLSTSASAPGGGGSTSWAMAGGPSFSSSRRTQAVDIFSLGCIFHHCIVPGSHPFGQWYEREANIIQEKATHLSELAHVPDAHDLVSLMTAREPDLRPSAGEVCKHPFFWNEEKRLSFLLEFSDRLEQDAVQSPLLVMVEAGADSVVGRSWDVRLDPELTEDAGRYRKYDFSSVRDLLRVVRNKRHHFHELPEKIKGLMSPLPGGFLRYVEERFPQLLMHCTKVTGSLLTDERLFKEYLVPFRRPSSPPIAAAAASSGTPSAEPGTLPGVPSASSADGSRSGVSVSPEVSGLAESSTEGGPAQASAGTAAAAASAGAGAGAGGDGETGGMSGASAAAAAVSEANSARPPSGPSLPNSVGGEGAVSATAAAAAAAAAATSSASPGKRPAALTPRSGRKSYNAGGAEAGDRGSGGGGGAPVRVTEQDGPRGEGALQDVLIWNESGMAKSMGCRGWWRHQDHWQRRLDVTKQRPRGAHLNKALLEPKYRTRLCSHWESSKGIHCPMRQRGASRCNFAHGSLELRVRPTKHDRWGLPDGVGAAAVNLDASGGVDTLGAARSIGRIRVENGEKDGLGVGGARGGPGGAKQGKRSKGGGGGGGGALGGVERPGARDRDTKANGVAPRANGFAGPRERGGGGGTVPGGNRSRSPRGTRGGRGTVVPESEVGREVRPAGVAAVSVANGGDAAWPPLSSQVEQPARSPSQKQKQQQQSAGGSSSAMRESRVENVVRLNDSSGEAP